MSSPAKHLKFSIITGVEMKNIELEALYSDLNILKVIRRGRLQWAGHAQKHQNPMLCAVSIYRRPNLQLS